jgi:hypothetical protein
MNAMFQKAYTFNNDIGSWEVSKLQDNACLIVHPISKNILDLGMLQLWDVSSTCFKSHMHLTKTLDLGKRPGSQQCIIFFYCASHFNQNIRSWNVARVGCPSISVTFFPMHWQNESFLETLFRGAVKDGL